MSSDLSHRGRIIAWRILVERNAAGADNNEIDALADLWCCDDVNAYDFAESVGVRLGRSGRIFCATPPGFVSVDDSVAGFGHTALDALVELCKAVGFEAGGPSFSTLLAQEAACSKN